MTKITSQNQKTFYCPYPYRATSSLFLWKRKWESRNEEAFMGSKKIGYFSPNLMSSSKHPCGRGTTCHPVSCLDQMLQIPTLSIHALLSTPYLKSCPLLAKTIKWQTTTYRTPNLPITLITSQPGGYFTTKKPSVIMPGCFTKMPGFFFLILFHFWLLFFTTLNFSKLFLTIQGGKVNCSRGGGAPLFIYLHFFYYSRGGGGG